MVRYARDPPRGVIVCCENAMSFGRLTLWTECPRPLVCANSRAYTLHTRFRGRVRFGSPPDGSRGDQPLRCKRNDTEVQER